MKQLITLTIVLSALQWANGQTNPFFKAVNDAQKFRIQNRSSELKDASILKLEEAMKQMLNESCLELPDSSFHYFLVNPVSSTQNNGELAYAFMNKIVVVSTGDLSIYSYDNLERGAGHSYTNYINYSTPIITCTYQTVNNREDYTEVGYYQLQHIAPYYIAFGYGSNGGGFAHHLIQIFEDRGGEIVLLEKRFILCNRIQNIHLRYNEVDSTLSYRQYKEKGNDLFLSNDYDNISLQLKAGKLVPLNP